MSLISMGRAVWRLYNTDGVPGSGNNQPDKGEITVWSDAIGALEPVVNLVPGIQTQVSTLLAAQSGGHVGFATYSAMVAAVASYTVGTTAECWDTDPTLAGIYIHGAGASWGSRVALLPAMQQAMFDFALRNLVPTATAPVVAFRVDQVNWLIRTPIVNGKAGEYTEWRIIDRGQELFHITHMMVMAGVSTNENGTRRIQSAYELNDGSVWEYAFNVGLMTDSPPTAPNWNLQGNGHGNVTYAGLSMKMDAGSELRDMAVGYVTGSSFVIAQTFGMLLPKDGTTSMGSINSGHTFNVNGCLVSHVHTLTLAGTGNQNSYDTMLPVTACNKARFGSQPTIDVVPGSGQSANQGLQTVFQAWHTDRPDLLLEVTRTLPSPDGTTNVTTSDTFIICQAAYFKAYFNYRSGTADVAAVNSTHLAQYRVRKSAAGNVGSIELKATGVNFNSANTDTAIAIALPEGVSRYSVRSVKIANASASLTTATCGVFSAAAAGGTAIVASASAITVSSASANTNNNAQSLTVAIPSTTESLNFQTLYFRVQTAQGSAATGDVIITVDPL